MSRLQAYHQSPYNYFMGSRAAFLKEGQASSVNYRLIQLPGLYILSGDANYDFDWADADPDNYSQDTLFGTGQAPKGLRPPPIHNRRLNVLFADGHVKNYKDFTPAEMTYSFSAPGVNF